MAQAAELGRAQLWSMHWLMLIRDFHIAAGVLAFVVLWIPLFAKKGSKLHVRGGRIYVYAMAAVAISGAPLALSHAFDPNRGRRLAGWFLFFVALLAWDSAWMGVRALRTKRREAPNRRPMDLAPPTLLVMGAVGVLAMGLGYGVTLYLFFGVLGTLIGVSHLRFWLSSPKTEGASILQHVGAMGTSSIATITAFLVVNARHLGLGTFNPYVWIAPVLMGASAIFLAQRAWRSKTEQGSGNSQKRGASAG